MDNLAHELALIGCKQLEMRFREGESYEDFAQRLYDAYQAMRSTIDDLEEKRISTQVNKSLTNLL